MLGARGAGVAPARAFRRRSPSTINPGAVLAGSTPEHDVDAVQDLRARLCPQASHSLGEERPIEGEDLRHVGDRSFGKPVVLLESRTLAGAAITASRDAR